MEARNGTGVLVNVSIAWHRSNQSWDGPADPTIPAAAFLKDPGAMGRLLKLREKEGSFGIWVPYESIFDMSIVVTLLIAVVTVALGSLWSGYVKHHLRQKLEAQQTLPRYRVTTIKF